MKKTGERNEEKDGAEQDGAQGVDFRGDAHAQHGVNLKRKRACLRTRDKEADDHVVHAHSEGKQRARQDRGRDQRQRDVEKGALRRRAQIARGLPNRRIERRQARLDIDKNVWDTEGRMRKHQRQHTGGQAYKRKKRQIRHAEDDLRHHNRDHGQVFKRAARPEMAAGQPHRPERAEHRGRRAADQRQLQTVEKRKREYALGKNSGKANIRKNLEDLGLQLDEDAMRKVTERIIELGDKKELVTQEDLHYIVSDVLKHGMAEERVSLKSYIVNLAYGLKPMADRKSVV